ncbi:hypothetical protein D2L64_25230 [Micromonospora radicis]|uniref:Uncharacterized protein n=1 Tax=Micromonospora radicis TaxID=1894971 RepID=A0A418MNF4_9ACTN|nr:hypothetical protein D2L64_25230 [Micromonospora radicis]
MWSSLAMLTSRRVLRTFAAVVAALAMTFAVAAPAHAADGSDWRLIRLVELNPGTTEEEMQTALEEAAVELGISYDEMLDQALAQADEAVEVDPCLPDEDEPLPDPEPEPAGFAIACSSTSPGVVNLGSGRYKGDIFHSWARTAKVVHNHVGIYYNTSTVVEAPGGTTNSRSVSASTHRVQLPVYKLSVSTTQTNRDIAANYAYNNLRNKAYDSNFAFNKTSSATKLNCSELVWRAYKKSTANIDLSWSWDPFAVYPNDIKGSSKTVTYYTRTS